MEVTLNLLQAAPAAVGSGRQSLHRKVHAVAHATRLTCKTWLDTVKLMNGCLTYTGDLGTESGFPTFKKHMRQLFGQWVIDADRLPDDDDGPMFVFGEDEFNEEEEQQELVAEGPFVFDDEEPRFQFDDDAADDGEEDREENNFNDGEYIFGLQQFGLHSRPFTCSAQHDPRSPGIIVSFQDLARPVAPGVPTVESEMVSGPLAADVLQRVPSPTASRRGGGLPG